MLKRQYWLLKCVRIVIFRKDCGAFMLEAEKIGETGNMKQEVGNKEKTVNRERA